MGSNALTTTILLVLLLLIALAGFVMWRRGNTQVEYTVESSEDNPALQAIAECRQAIIEQLVQSFGLTFHCLPDELSTSIESTDFDTNIVTIAYQDFLCRLYCDWSRGRIKFELGYLPYLQPDQEFVNTKTFKVRRGCVDLASVDNFLRDGFYQYCGLHNSTNNQLVESAAMAVKISQDKETSDKELTKLLIAVWDDFRISQNSKEAFTDITNATRLLAYILRFHKSDFEEYVKQSDKDIKDKK